MVQDKFNWCKVLPKLSWFTLFGIGNAFCYGLSHLMSEKDYHYYFAYKGNGRGSDWFRSQMGSNNFANAVWTIPSLIFVGQYMHGKVGWMTMFKFTPLALLSILAFQTAFNPNPESRALANIRLLGGLLPRFDSIGHG